MPTEGSALTAVAFSTTLHCLTGCAIGEITGMIIGTALGFSDLGTIALAVYSAFSAAVVGGIWHQIEAATLLILVGVCGLILAVVLLVTRYGSRLLGFGRKQEVAIVFCGSKKTLASGVPMARVLFAGPDMGAAVLPLMIFHQMQLMVCAWLARRYELKVPVGESSYG